jgi:hypothetical protein
MLKSKKLRILVILVLLGLGFLFRLYRFNNPIADWHSWRQADTSSVSRNFVSNGFDLLHPRFDDLSNVPSGIDNPNGYRFVELPVFNVLQAGGFMLFNSFTLEQWGRLVSIFASLFSAFFLYLIIKKRFGTLAGLFTMFFFLFLPFNIYYSRVILPDPLMVTAILAGIYFFEKWTSDESKSFFVLSVVFSALAFLIRPYALFFSLPIFYLAYEKYGFTMFKKWYLWLFLIISVVPLVSWRYWMMRFPEGIPQSNWLFNGGDVRFKGSFFRWIFGERIGKLILGFWGSALFALGFVFKQKKNDVLFLFSFLFSSILYVFVIARGNLQHDYYQILIIPSIAIYLGIGSCSLVSFKSLMNKFSSYVLLLVIIVFTLFFSWYFVRDYFNINNNSIIIAGQQIDKIIPKDARIIANYNGDTSFLYQTKRKGWASFEKGLPEMVQMGASYLALVNPTDKDLGIGKEYKIVVVTKDFVLFDLLQKP